MNGLCGVVYWDDAPVDRNMVRRMANAAPHRGSPTLHAGRRACFAHLAASRERQELFRDDEDHIIVSSARIDNRDDLTPVLFSYLTTTNPTDAELILAAHRRWDGEAPTHLIGDFAYAIYDVKRRSLVAARDPMGMRPLYFHHTPRQTLFASEVHQVLASGVVPAQINESSVARYLIDEFGIEDETFFGGVSSLRAGYALTVDVRGAATSQFWRIDFADKVSYEREEHYADHLRDLFIRSVRDRLRDSRPVGILLSGGVDSCSIASAVGWLGENGTAVPRVHAFSNAYEDMKECDERELSSIVVDRYGLCAHIVDAEAHAPLSAYPAHGPSRDEPFIVPFQPNLEAALAAAKELGVTSMWSGNRGDALNGRLPLEYERLFLRGRWSALMAALREHTRLSQESVLGLFLRHVARPSVRRVLRRQSRRPDSAHSREYDARRPPWLREEFLHHVGVDPDLPSEAPPPPPTPLGQRQRRYRYVSAPQMNRVAILAERTNAKYGQTFVDPWADQRLAEFMIAVPQAVLNRPGPSKRLARAAMRGVMPDELRARAKKTLPTPAYLHALRVSSAPIVYDLLTNMEAERRGFVNASALQQHYRSVVDGRPLHSGFWYALTLEMWLRSYFV